MATKHIDLASETSVKEAIAKIETAIIEIGTVNTKSDTTNTGVNSIKTGISEIKSALFQIQDALNVYSAPVYGFIEHMDILNPAQRIEYIEKNKDFTPMTMNFTTGAMNYGSWNDFWFLRANRPAMVKFNGVLDYWLNPDDYTKKEDGTASDVANLDYQGGAYAWIPKIYKCEYVIGNDRYVLFCQQKINDDFLPNGFIDFNNKELDGVWLPMFYGVVDSNGKMRSLASGNPTNSRTTDQQKTAISACGDRHVFFGGGVANTIVDLLTMFVKTTNSQAAYGNGSSTTYVNDASQNYGALDNAVISGGQFYGSNTGKKLNKMLHSIILASQVVWVRDPYMLIINGVFYVSKNYTYDVTGATYINTGITCQDQGWETKSAVATGFGRLPVKAGGTDATGYCDHAWVNKGITAVCLRFADCSDGSHGGLFALGGLSSAGDAWWGCGAAPLLLPPATA